MKGRTGPPKTPTNLAALRGNPGKRPINKREPKPAPLSGVAPPPWLAEDPIAVEEWNSRAPELARLGLLTQLSAPALARACRWMSKYRQADQALESGMTGVSRNNGEQASPWVGIALKCHAAADAILARFGETPSDLTRLSTPEAEAPEDPMEKLLRAREARRSA